MADSKNLTESLKKLETIVGWFDEQQEVDVEQGLTKVREAATLIKESKARLAEIENEFEAIEKEISDGDEPVEDVSSRQTVQEVAEDIDDRPVDLSEIPF